MEMTKTALNLIFLKTSPTATFLKKTILKELGRTSVENCIVIYLHQNYIITG